MASKTLRIHPLDNVAVALVDLPGGDRVGTDGDTVLLQDVPAKHKFAVKDLAVDDDVVMYGVLVGKATTAIKKRWTDFHVKHPACFGRLPRGP